MQQTYHTRGLLAFLEDQIVIAIEAFLSNDAAGVDAALARLETFVPNVRKEMAKPS
jgi:hypothetical protein